MTRLVRVHECARCGHTWVRRLLTDTTPPARCAGCKSPYWQSVPTVPQRRPKKYRDAE